MSGGGKSQTSTSSVSIPPEVLARYNSVNTRAEETGNIPFQPYGGEFVAPLSQTQQAGVANINQAAGMAQPYYQGATESLLGGASQAQPYYQAATQQVGGSLAAAAPLQQASMINQLAGQQAGQQALAAGTAQSQPVYNTALTGLGNIAGVTSPLQAQSLRNIDYATAAAAPLSGEAVGNIARAQGLAQPYMGAAGQALGAAAGAAQPMQQEAYSGIGAAQAAGSPYQQLATQYGLAGARQLTPEGLSVDRYMSPYIQSVAEPTMRALRQQQQMEQQSILGDQIKGGAFGGDRGRIAQAVLAQQQGLATAKAMGDIYQQGYGQAVSTAQQQQGLQLAAEQANRLAQQQAAQQMLGIGQQGFGQNLSAAQQRAALGQQLFGQGLGMAQQQAALGQQAFNQAAQTSQQQAALSQLQYGQQMGAAQAQQTLAQQLASQGLGTAQAQAGIGQQLFGQGAQAAQQLYGMGAGTAAQQAALAQQQYAQQMGAAQQLQGLGQGLYGMGAGVSQGLAGLGTGAQQAALQGGQAQLGAGQLEQQTRQAENQAYYNQFLQQQGYPYQVAQFLANVAMGTGALSGSTTTTTQPSSFFSDKRLKDDIEPIGKTYDGQDIVRYRYKGEPATRIGLVAQDVEKKHPEAVGLAGGYKTVDYDKATDAAAARAPKAYGGGLNPWGDASAYGGSVFREDAWRGYAVGGAPGGDDILAQINALVNSHQGMFPYGKAGMYGSGMGKAGPYGSTLMPAPNRSLMRAENVGTRPVSAMEGIESTVKRAENIRNLYRGAKGGVEFVKTESQLSPTYTTAGQGPTQSGEALGTPTTIRDYLDSFFGGANQGTVVPEPGMYRGGLVRGNYAMGGMPYSQAENEYVPEDISAPVKPQGLQPAKPAAPGRTTGDDIMTMIKLASMASGMGFSSGGLVPRQGYQPGGEVTENVPEGYLDFVSRLESGGDPNATNRLFPVERGGPEGRFQFTRDTWLDLAKNDPRFEGQSVDQILAARRDPVVSALYATRYGHQNAPVLRAAGLDPNQENLALAHMQGPVGARALLTNPTANVVDALLPVYGNNRERVAQVISQNRGNPDMSASDFAAHLLRQRGPAQGLGLPAAQNNQQEGNQQQPGLVPRSADQSEQQKPAEKDWFGRNESWIMPLVTGLGTMASSPSRYLGSAVLQGLMGAGQAAQQNIALEGQRLKTAEETKKIASETGRTAAQSQEIYARIAASAESPDRRTVRIFRNGRFILIPREEFWRNPSTYSMYAVPYSEDERRQFSTPPGRGEPPPGESRPPASTTAPPDGAARVEPPPSPDGRQDAAAVPPPNVPTTRSVEGDITLIPALAEETRNLADREASRSRQYSPNELPAVAERTRDVFNPGRARAASASASLSDRVNLAKEFMALPDTDWGSLGRTTQFVTPILAWVNSTLSTFNVPDPRNPGQTLQFNADRLARLEALDKEAIQNALRQQGDSGGRAYRELEQILSATPNTRMSRQSVEKILATNFSAEQRAIDFDNFLNLWRNYVTEPRENAVGINENELRLTGPQAEREFERLYGAQFVKEKAGIERILGATVGGKPLIDRIVESQGRPSQQMIDYMNQHFANEGGARLLRYFYGR